MTPALDVRRLERPVPALMTYFAIFSLVTGPLYPVIVTMSYFRYKTMRYRFDDEGVSMSWGILFRREIHLTYARIQDIHLSSNFLERRLGLARIQIQTASGSSGAEMTIEGIAEFEELRDYLYGRMRGAQPSTKPQQAPEELTETLLQVAAELRAIRERLDARPN